MKNLQFHVYSDNGFESAHRTESAARAAAKRGSKAAPRGGAVKVIKCSAYGLTGGGHGTLIASYDRGAEVQSSAGEPYRYRVVDTRSGRVLAAADTLPGLYPESDREWATSQERTADGWRDVPSMRRAPDGRWL